MIKEIQIKLNDFENENSNLRKKLKRKFKKQ